MAVMTPQLFIGSHCLTKEHRQYLKAVYMLSGLESDIVTI